MLLSFACFKLQLHALFFVIFCLCTFPFMHFSICALFHLCTFQYALFNMHFSPEAIYVIITQIKSSKHRKHVDLCHKCL